MRIGFAANQSDPFRLDAGVRLDRRLVVSSLTIHLDTIRVGGRNPCARVEGDSAAAAFRIWSQIRTALEASQATMSLNTVATTTVAYEQLVERGSRKVRSQRVTTHSEFVKQPWRAIPPTFLHDSGFVVLDADSTTYNAPSIEFLLSEYFLADHCLRVVADQKEKRVGLSFVPAPDRKKVAEIRGTLWVDRATAELRELDFDFVNLSAPVATDAGGKMRFIHLKNGMWVTGSWNVRMPTFALVPRLNSTIQGTRWSETTISGGELIVARNGSDTLWSRPAIVISGVVADSSTGIPVGMARVSLGGTSATATTSTDGRYHLDGILPGIYVMEIRTPSLDSIGAIHRTNVDFADSSIRVDVRIPTGRQVVTALCRQSAQKIAAGFTGVIVGRVTSDTDSAAVTGTRISAEWRVPLIRAERSGAVVDWEHHAIESLSGSEGTFRLCGVPRQTDIKVAVQGGAAGTSVPVRLESFQAVAFVDLQTRHETSASAVFSGIVVDSLGGPIPGAEVAISDVGLSALANDSGRFRIDGVPAGSRSIVARHIGFGPLAANVLFGTADTVVRRLVLSRIVVLDSVVSVGRAPWQAEFDQHRKIGLGVFLDRAEISPYDGGALSTALRQKRGFALVSNRYVISSLAPPGLGPGSIYRPSAPERRTGVVAGCYAQVYVDGTLMNRGAPTPPFDLSTIAPERVSAIEFYGGPAQTPAGYSGLGSPCGVLIVHLRKTD